jgi:CBS domain-containing protein
LNDEIRQMYDQAPRRTIDGETLRLPIRELRLKNVVELPPSGSVLEAVELMARESVGCVMIVEDGKLVGVFTERDVLVRVVKAGRDAATTPLVEVMTSEPSTLTPDHMIAYALNFMHVGGFRHVPVVDEELRPLGLVDVRVVLAYLAEFFPEDVRNLPPPHQAEHMPRDGG